MAPTPKEDPVPLPELPCEKSDAYFVLRDGAAGVVLAANTFPKSRETRAPLVEELYRFQVTAAGKLRYLADAHSRYPAKVAKTMVRFTVKTKQQYVSSEKDGKATGWSAFYVDGKWVEGKNNLLILSGFYKQRVAKAASLLHIIFSSHLYTKAINDIVVIVSTFLLLIVLVTRRRRKSCSDGV